MRHLEKAAASKAPTINSDSLLNFGCELEAAAETDPDGVAVFAQTVQDAMMAFHRSRKHSVLLVEANDIVDPTKPLRIEIESPSRGCGTIYIAAESGRGLANLSLTLSDAERLRKDLGRAIRDLRSFLSTFMEAAQ